MTRVKFVRSTDRYARGALATLPDDQAQKAIAMGDAEKTDQAIEVGDAPQAEPTRRVIFLRNYEFGTGESKRQWPKEARATIPTKIADAAIKSGHAKDFPVTTVGNEDKAMKPALARTK